MNSSSASICFISNSSGQIGGAEKTLPIFVQRIQMKGFHVHVILPSRGPMVHELEKRNIEYSIVPFRMWMHENASMFKKVGITIFNLIFLTPLCIRIILSKSNLVFSNTITVSIGAIAAKLTGRKHIWYIREFGLEDHRRTFDLGDQLSYWLIKRLSHVYILNSCATANKYIKYLPENKIRVIYEGYIEEIVIHVDEINHKRRCLMVGTIQEGKGHIDAIKAVGELKREGFEIILDIVGQSFDFEYKEKLGLLISSYQLDKNVFFHEYTNDPSMFFRRCNVYLMCSKMEAFGIVTVEAMQFGKPIIGANSGGTKELVREGFNGVLYTPGDYLELAKKIKYLFSNQDVSRKLGDNGREWALNRFTLTRYVDEICEVLQSTANQTYDREKQIMSRI